MGRAVLRSHASVVLGKYGAQSDTTTWGYGTLYKLRDGMRRNLTRLVVMALLEGLSCSQPLYITGAVGKTAQMEEATA